MEKYTTFKLKNETGEEIEYVALKVVENEGTGKSYLIYTEVENAKDSSGKQVDLHACVYKKENENIVLEPIETEKERIHIKGFIAQHFHVV